MIQVPQFVDRVDWSSQFIRVETNQYEFIYSLPTAINYTIIIYHYNIYLLVAQPPTSMIDLHIKPVIEPVFQYYNL